MCVCVCGVCVCVCVCVFVCICLCVCAYMPPCMLHAFVISHQCTETSQWVGGWMCVWGGGGGQNYHHLYCLMSWNGMLT